MGIYEQERDKISRTPQVIVTIAMTSCDNNYTDAVGPSTCTAADAGNGSRCYYSFATCQDTAHFRIDTSGVKLFKFCLKDAPLPVASADIWPMLKSVVFAPAKIDPEKAVTVSERVKLVFYDDASTGNWNQDKASAGKLTNTGAPSGTFWRRFMRIYRNYANPRNYVTVNVGFVAVGAVESDFKQRGKYLINNLEIGPDGTVTLTLIDKLKLLRTKAPAKISETNLLNGAIDNAVTSATVDDGSELTTPGSGYTVTILMDSEYMNVTGIAGNILTVQRGRWGTSAASHADNAAWKEVLMFGTERATPSLAPLGKNAIDIVVELLSRAGIADIDTMTLNQERDDWIPSTIDIVAGTENGTTFRRAGGTLDAGNGGISVQTDIETLVRQIRDVVPLALWIGEDQKVTGRVFAPARASVTLTEITDNENIIKGSISVDDNEESRADIILVGYDLAAGKDGSKLADYQKVLGRIDADAIAVGAYGDRRTRIILSPWIRTSDAATPSRLAVHTLGRFRNPARKIIVKLEVKDDAIKTGDFSYVSTSRICKADGSTDSQRIMEVQSKERDPNDHTLTLQLQDTGLIYKYAFIAPAGYPNWDSATLPQQRYGYIGSAIGNKLGALKAEGKRIW